MTRIIAALLFSLIASAIGIFPASAQTPQPPGVSTICATCSAQLAVTNTTGHVALPTTLKGYIAVTLYNAGTKDLFFNLGDSTVTAAVTNTRLPAGFTMAVNINGATSVAAITGGSDTTTLDVFQSNGALSFRAPGGAGGGGGVGACSVDTSVLFNSGGAIACDAGLKYLSNGQLTITNSTANTTPLTISGGSVTGSNTTKVGATISATINTTGIVKGAYLFANSVGAIAAGAGSTVLDIQANSVSLFSVDTGGKVSAPNGINSSAQVDIASLVNGLTLTNGRCYQWLSSTTFAPGNVDTSICRSGAGIIQIGSGSTVNVATGSVLAASYRAGVVYAAAGTPLPTCNAGLLGARYFVSDSTVSAYGTTYTSGGANNEPVFCNGTNWVIGANDNDYLKDVA